MINIIFAVLFIIILGCAIGFAIGPVVKHEQVNDQPLELDIGIESLDAYVEEREAGNADIKPDNHAHILWADGVQQTECAVVYLHGFSASHGEAYPLLQNFAQRFHCNAYLSRLSFHGLKDPDAFLQLTPESLVESAKEAIAIGRKLGKKVILMSTSTGSTLSVYLAGNDPDVHSLIMMSPNFDTHDPKMKMLTKPWGKQLFRYFNDSDYREWEGSTPKIREYWTVKNRIEGYIALRHLMEQTMTSEIYSRINIPYFIGYYYKNENEYDDVISISAIEEFDKSTRTPADQKVTTAFSTATGHVIGTPYQNPNWQDVQTEIFNFAEAKLRLPVKAQD